MRDAPVPSVSRPPRGQIAERLREQAVEAEMLADEALAGGVLNQAGFPRLRGDGPGGGSAAERVNGSLKDNFGGKYLRVRGAAKVFCHLMFGVLALTVDQLMRLLT